MIKVAICDDDIQFIYKLEQSIFRFAEMKRIKVDVEYKRNQRSIYISEIRTTLC